MDDFSADNSSGSNFETGEEDLLIFSWTQDAIISRQLLTILPVIYEFFTFIGSEAIQSR